MKQFINNIVASWIMMLLMWSTAQAQPAERRYPASENKVAILPITYVAEGYSVRTEEMRYRLQQMAYSYLRSQALELRFQDPAETNSLLRRNGVREGNIRDYSPRELAEILGVEFILTGMVTQDLIGESTVRNARRENDYDRRGRRESHTHEHTMTMQNMSTNIDLSIYNYHGENIFSKGRRSILTNADAYRNGLEYLLKRTPLYRR